MLVKFREKYALIYVIITVALFKIGQRLGLIVSKLLDNANLLTTNENIQDYLVMTINDFVVVIIMIILLLLTNKKELLKKKGQSFFKSMPIAGYPIGFIIFAFVANIVHALNLNTPLNDGLTIFTYLLCMFMVGLSEELCNRAISVQTLLEHYGTDKKGIWKAAIISGVLFGCLHLFNLQYGDVLKVVVQAIAATATGVLYAAIYFRSGNIWLMVVIHALHDIAAASSYGIFNGGSINNMLASQGTQSLFGLIVVIPQIIAAIYLLRNKKIGEVKITWSEIKGN